MSVITAYKSDADGKIFEDKKKYQNHLRKLATARRYERKVYIDKEKKIAFLRNNFWEKVKSPAQLQAALLIHAEYFGLNGLAHESFYGRKRPDGPPLLKKFSTFDLRYNPQVSNTHDCPHNGVTNWGGDKPGAPRGYPGLQGRFDYNVEWYAAWEGWYPGGSDMWEGTRIHTGTGGGGGFKRYDHDKTKGLQGFGYGVSIFFDDWPGLKASYDEAKEEYEKALHFHILKGKHRSDLVFNMDAWVNEKYPAEDYV
jgi:hypothetical protein